MRLSQARVAPVTDAELTDEQREVIEGLTERRRPLKVYRTLVRAPVAMRKYLEWGGYVMSKRNALSPRAREIVILRVGVMCRSGYEFAQHSEIGLNSGLTPEDIGRIKAGADAPGWSAEEAVLVRAVDELVGDHFISDATWAELGRYYDQKACMDVVFTAGQYVQTCMFLNTFGVQLEEGAALDPIFAER